MGVGEPTRKRGDGEGEAAGEGSRVERDEGEEHLQEEGQRRGGGQRLGEGAVARRARVRGRRGIYNKDWVPPKVGGGVASEGRPHARRLKLLPSLI